MKENRATPPPHRLPRVVWTGEEKSRLIARAVETQAEHPDLAGLPLLRAAMSALAPNRRRKLLAVTQASWFEIGVADEIRRRTERMRLDADLTPLVARNTANTAGIHEDQQRFIAFHESWRNEMATRDAEQIRLLRVVIRELRRLGKRIDALGENRVISDCAPSTRE